MGRERHTSFDPPNVFPSVRVLVPFTFARWGGVRSLLGAAIPRLSATSGLEIEYAELFRNGADMDEMETRGVRVNRTLGVRGRGVLSTRRGIGRWIDLLFAAPFLLRLLWKLRRSIEQFDVVYAHLVRDLFLVGLAVITIPPTRRPIVVWHCHGVGERGVRPLMKCLANRCAAVVAVSEDVAERLSDLGVHRSLIKLVGNAVDASEIQASAARWSGELPRRAEGQVTLLLPAASMRHDKGVHLALSALRRLPANVVLWITGDPEDVESATYKDELEHLIESGNLHERVAFLGLRRDIYGIMSRADVIVVPSVWREPFGLVAAEAMALGRPVVVANRGALPGVVDHGRAGVVFDPEVDGSLTAAVADVLSGAAATEQRIANGLTRVENVFSYDMWVGEIAAILKRVPTRGQGRWARFRRSDAEFGGDLERR